MISFLVSSDRMIEKRIFRQNRETKKMYFLAANTEDEVRCTACVQLNIYCCFPIKGSISIFKIKDQRD